MLNAFKSSELRSKTICKWLEYSTKELSNVLCKKKHILSAQNVDDFYHHTLPQSKQTTDQGINWHGFSQICIIIIELILV